MTGEPTSSQQANDIYAIAWGAPWPYQRQETIAKTDIVLGDDDLSLVSDDSAHVYGSVDSSGVPDALQYTCFDRMEILRDCFGCNIPIPDSLVELTEYVWLDKLLSKRTRRAVLIAGHLGTGKSSFLWWLLLQRLQRRLPTAVQANSTCYYIFDEQGASVFPIQTKERRLRHCWALTVHNADVRLPCGPFLNMAESVVLASCTKREHWHTWMKERSGTIVITELPTTLEIAAIAKETGRDTSAVGGIVRKWGPSIRTVLKILDDPGCESQLEQDVLAIAQHICAEPFFISSLSPPHGTLPGNPQTALLFVRPLYLNNKKTKGKTERLLPIPTPCIPTKYLSGIFESMRKDLQVQVPNRRNLNSILLFEEMNARFFSRPSESGGWGLEKMTHRYLCSDSVPLTLSRSHTRRTIHSSANLLPGTLDGLRHAPPRQSFYWMPTAPVFKGIDGVLGDNAGNVYAIQAMAPNDYCSPISGLQRLSEELPAEIVGTCKWNFVIIAKNEGAAAKYVERFSEKLRNVKVANRASISVWGSVLP